MGHERPRRPIALDAARQQLEHQRGEILERLNDLDSELRGATTSQLTEGTIANHPADAAGELLIAETDVSTINDLRAEIASIDEALARVDAGTYGYCIECGNPIDQGRLKALPNAARCIDCQRRFDYAGG